LLSQLETWQGIAVEIQAELPDGVSLGKVPQADGILLKMKFKADYFVARQRSTILLRHGKRLLGRLVIVGRK